MRLLTVYPMHLISDDDFPCAAVNNCLCHELNAMAFSRYLDFAQIQSGHQQLPIFVAHYCEGALSSREYVRIVEARVTEVGLDPTCHGTHSRCSTGRR